MAPRPAAAFTFDRLATTLRDQRRAQDEMDRFAASGDAVPWAGAMGADTVDPPAFAAITGYVLRFNDLVFFTFEVAAASSSGGSGAYRLPLPVPAYSNSSDMVGWWTATQGASSCDGRLAGAGATRLWYRTANPGTRIAMAPTQPYSWAAGNTIVGSGLYVASQTD